MKNYFTVRYGYNVLEKIRIEEKDLARAIYAQLKKVPVQLGNMYLDGKEIKTITPDYHYYTGWHDTYVPKELEDMQQIERDCPKNLDSIIAYHKDKVSLAIRSNNPKLLQDIPPYNSNQIERKKETLSGAVDVGSIIKRIE